MVRFLGRSLLGSVEASTVRLPDSDDRVCRKLPRLTRYRGTGKEWALLETFDVPTHLVTFRVDGRAVPWKVPTVVMSRRGKRRAFKDRTLVAWQEVVHRCSKLAWGVHRSPYDGPVGMCLWFYVHPPTRQRVVTADVTNLAKAFEDGCKGTIIADDRQVFASHLERYFVGEDEPQRSFAQFWAIPRGVIEPTYPGPFAFNPREWWNAKPDD